MIFDLDLGQTYAKNIKIIAKFLKIYFSRTISARFEQNAVS
jgi:hypothetical protein